MSARRPNLDEPSIGAAATLLHSIGYLCLRAGNRRRALAFLLIANRIAPDNPRLLRALAGALLANGAAQQAIAALERLAAIEGGRPAGSQLMLARAAWSAGDKEAARSAIHLYLATRDAT